MNLELVKRIADAVLYEGYILYPYRPSSVKNRLRFNFGVLTPRSYSEAERGTEAWSMRTECLVEGAPDAALDVKVRFLGLVEREVAEPAAPIAEWREGEPPELRAVASLDVDGREYASWQEAVEREVECPGLGLGALAAAAEQRPFSFAARRELTPIRDASGRVAGAVARAQHGLEGRVEVSAERLEERLFRVGVGIFNTTPFEEAGAKRREDALRCSLVSTHTVVGVHGGEFVSLLDPPDRYRAAAAACRNLGAWPVLVGANGERDLVLSSPIILYDYPEVAAESAGDLFDGTEIDEILTLRILTLTEDEKREMRGADDRARRILERTEAMPAEQFMKLHGAVRGLRTIEE